MTKCEKTASICNISSSRLVVAIARDGVLPMSTKATLPVNRGMQSPLSVWFDSTPPIDDGTK